MSITELLTDRRRDTHKVFGVMVGIVTNNHDPNALGRVKVKIPRLSGDDESNWARVASMMAGPDRGTFFLPEVDDEVLVAFDCGDINQPYVIGALWNGKDKPPATNSDGANNLRVIKSRSGHQIRLDDTEGNEKIEIIDKTGNNRIVMDTKNDSITIRTERDIEFAAPNGNVKIHAKDIEIKASAGMTLKGATVEIN